MAGHAADRRSEDILREITAIIRQLKDPRLSGKMLTVVRVEVSSDASFAKVFVSDFGGIESAKEACQIFTAASGYIRREVGTKLKMRKAPQLKFVPDDSVEKSFEMFSKI